MALKSYWDEAICFICRLTISPIRIQGAYIPDKDVQHVTDFIRDQQTAEYDESMMVSDEEISEEASIR